MLKLKAAMKMEFAYWLRQSFPDVYYGMVARKLRDIYAQAGVAFLHVPKAAGISISRSLYGTGVSHLPLEQLLKQVPEVSEMPLFTVVREPWSRLHSAYRFIAQGVESGVGGVFRPAQYRVSAFESFNRFIEEWLATRDVDTLDNVLKTQAHYLGGAAGVGQFSFIGRVEQMDETHSWLQAQCGRKIELPHLNRSRGGEQVVWDNLSPRAVAIVLEKYGPDFELLDYPCERPGL